MRASRIRASFLPAMELLPNIGLIFVLGYGGWQVIAGQLSLGSLIAFNVYVALLIWPLRMLGMIIAQGQRAAAATNRQRAIVPGTAGKCPPAGAVSRARIVSRSSEPKWCHASRMAVTNNTSGARWITSTRPDAARRADGFRSEDPASGINCQKSRMRARLEKST